LLVLIFGEIFPKTLATRYADRLALGTSGLYIVLMKVLFPIVVSIDWMMSRMQSKKPHGHSITDEEIEAFIDQGQKAGLFEK
jgi:putative hemolysin